MSAGQGPRPVIFGEVLFDCFPDGGRVAGGAPFNVAWHLQAFGAAPVLVSGVGEDQMGEEILAAMARWGLSGEGLQHDPGHPTGEVRVSFHDGQPNFDIVDGRAYDHIRADRVPALEVSLIYHGSLALRQHTSAAALDRLLEASGAPVFLDVNLRDPWWSPGGLARRLDGARWAKLNHEELTLLAGAKDGPAGGAMRLVERHHLEFAIVTVGERGALLLDREGGRIDSPPVPASKVVDTVGAGDAFASVCILGLLRGWPLPTMLERAQRFASMGVARRGATSECSALYRDLLEEWGLEH